MVETSSCLNVPVFCMEFGSPPVSLPHNFLSGVSNCSLTYSVLGRCTLDVASDVADSHHYAICGSTL